MAQRKVAVAYNTERARWEAVLKRDRAAGNAFVYTVSSTGIYCRPTCPARVARRANVGFCNDASEAAALGYRPCRRCKPELVEGQPEDAAVMAIKNFVTSPDAGRKFQTLRQMADQAGLSKWHFHRTFTKVIGITPGEWTKQQKQIAATDPSIAFAMPIDPSTGFNFGEMSPADSGSTTSSPTSLDSVEDLDQVFGTGNISEDEWLNMIDFDALNDAVDWNSFDVL